jgi:hypothetical protein
MQFPTLGGGMRRFVLLQRLKPWANCGVPLLSLQKKLDAALRDMGVVGGYVVHADFRSLLSCRP